MPLFSLLPFEITSNMSNIIKMEIKAIVNEIMAYNLLLRKIFSLKHIFKISIYFYTFVIITISSVNTIDKNI